MRLPWCAWSLELRGPGLHARGLFKVDRGCHMRVWQLHNWVASGELSETRNAAQYPPTPRMAP